MFIIKATVPHGPWASSSSSSWPWLCVFYQHYHPTCPWMSHIEYSYFSFLTAHTSHSNMLHLCKSTSMHSSVIKEQSYHQWPCLALINNLRWHINILYILIFFCLWLISLSAALDAEEEDRGGARWTPGAWSCGNLYTDWISEKRGPVYANQFRHYVTTGEESEQAGGSKSESQK